MTENKVANNTTTENDLIQFEELMNDVAKLPDEKRAKVAIFVQGFMAAMDCKKTLN